MENNINAQIKFKLKTGALIAVILFFLGFTILIPCGMYGFKNDDYGYKWWLGIDFCVYGPAWYYDTKWHLEPTAYIAIAIWVVVYMALIFILLQIRVGKLCELTVTEREVSGAYTTVIPIFKKTLKMPIEKIDNIVVMNGLQEKLSFGKRIVISSTAGKISFPFVWNADEIVEKVLASMGRKSVQDTAISAPREEQNSASSVIGKIKELSELKNAGIITEEEFELKKKELLGKM